MYSGCVLDSLSWQMQRSGLLTATASLVAQGETIASTTAAGTPADLDLQRFGHFNGAITRNGQPLGNVVSAEITYANNLDRIETIRSDGRIDGADPSIAALTGKIEVRFADQTLVNQAIAGDPCELTFAYVLPSGESFTFTAHAVYLPRPRIEIPGPQGIQATFDWQAARRQPRWAGCAPPRSSTTSRSTDHAAPEPRPRGLTGSTSRWACACKVEPLTTAIMVAARTDPAVRSHRPRHARREHRGDLRQGHRRAAPSSIGRGWRRGWQPDPGQPRGHRRASRPLADLREVPDRLCRQGSGARGGKKRLTRPRRLGLRWGRRLLPGLRRALPGLPARS